MEVDPSPVPPPQEYSDSPSAPYQSESSINFDYLHGLNAGAGTNMEVSCSTSSSTSQLDDANAQRHFSAISEGGEVDYSKAVDRPLNITERFVTVLDQLDARVEKFRKDALSLQEKRDFLNMSVDLIRSNELMQTLNDSEREEVSCYIQRVHSRLSTVELHVRTIRDTSQEDSLSQINSFIDMMITLGDPVLSRQRCQMYLNACCSADETGGASAELSTTSVDGCAGNEMSTASTSADTSAGDTDAGPIDKKFENVLLGCTLDDQKNIKRRLQALMCYLNKQIIHH